MKKLLLLLPLTFFLSCQEDETIIQLEENNNFNPYPKGYFLTEEDKLIDTVRFEYENNLVTKRIGEFVDTSTSTDFIYFFSKQIESNVNYNGNQAVIKRVSKIEGVSLPEDIQIYNLNGKQINDAIFTYQTKPNFSEKYVYNYKNNQIKSIDLLISDSVKKNDLTSSEEFYFNSKGNLDSVVYRDAVYLNGLPTIDYNSKARKVTRFINYDESQNLFQNLGIFKDQYFRSLSKNNFRGFIIKDYDKNGNPLNYSDASWTYEYVNGEVKVLK